ncbi:hypothetical protein HUU05_03765 [candidate division KSB1 bacterium]|nr:hypothetical protein [candidate division KSB1 bacterium]
MTSAIVTISAKLPFEIAKKGKWYISSCPLLDVVSQGRTEKKAKENLIEAVSLFFMSCIERNTIDEVLRECGLMEYQTTTRRPARLKKSKNIMDIPLYLLSTSSIKPVACQA